LKPSFLSLLNFDSFVFLTSWYFLCITRVNFGALHSFGFRKLRKQNGELLVEAGKNVPQQPKRSANAYAQKTFQNPAWVPERKATNPFLNLLLRKNEKGHR
jgi:hypothetical protein